MPGLYHCIGQNSNSVKKYLKTHSDIFFQDIIKDKRNTFFTFGNRNYPTTTWECGGYYVVFLGMIYNNFNSIKSNISKIVKEYQDSSNSSYLEQINSFVQKSDGDYIIYAYSKKDNTGFLFNDILGRLPIYYYSDGKTVSICSEQKGVLHNIPRIEPDRFQVVNMISFSFTLGNKTLFQGVSRLQASTILQFDDRYIIKEIKGVSFEDKERKKLSRKEATNYIAQQIEKSIRNRVETLSRFKYRIIADLTGGFDSRIVFGSLSKYSKEVNYYTFEYIYDESIIANNLFKKLGSPGYYTKLSFVNEIEKDNIPSIVYKTDGLINYYTSYICYNDLTFLYSQVSKRKTARFGGLGGEFFRHPYKKKYKDLFYGVSNGFYNRKFDLILDFVKVSKSEYYQYLKEYIDANYNEDIETNLKRFYFYEYYRKHVGLSAEDRERIHFWSVQPLWTKELIFFFINDFPLKWASYDFFTGLMNKVDARLLLIPIYGRPIRLNSKLNRVKYDLEIESINRHKTELLHFIKDKMNILYRAGRGIKKVINTEKKRENENISEYEDNKEWQTINIYIEELKRSYPEKFLENE